MLKATGIVRRVDDLGRIVLPKELRRVHKIAEGDPMEIFVDSEGEIILRKYQPGCVLCGSMDNTRELIGRTICGNCHGKLKVL